MRKVIILQKSDVFTVDIAKVYNQDKWELYLIANLKSYDCLCERNQNVLFSGIDILEDFDFNLLKKAIEIIIGHTPRELISIVTNSENLVAVAGRLREFFSIPGLDYSEATIFCDKIHMKKHIAKYDVMVPRYILFNKHAYLSSPHDYINGICEYMPFPLIAKPIDSSGSRGVIKIYNKNELYHWADSIESNMFELDEFIEGELYHCDSFVYQGNIIHTSVCRYSSYPHQFLFGYNLGSITLPDSHPAFEKFKIFNNRILGKISTAFSGVTHLEAFEKPDGQLVFLEVANRGGGAGISKMYDKHLNMDLFSTHFLLQLDYDFQWDIKHGQYAAWMQFPPGSNVLDLKDIPRINSKIDLISKNKKIGANSPCVSLRDYTLSVVLWNDDFEQLKKDFDFLSQYLN